MSQQALIKFQGKIYSISTPNEATTAQAAAVFASEVAKGNVSKLGPGAVLANPATLQSLRGGTSDSASQTQGPDLSRQERGTAGVGRESDVAGIVALTRLLLSYPRINNNEVVDGITFADYVTETPATLPVADLNVTQVQSLMSALALETNQDNNTLSQSKGIGRYGLNALQLEITGYLKPGTASKYFGQNFIFQNNPTDFETLLQSPNIWTGKDNVTSIEDLLLDSNLQAKILQELYQVNYDALTNLGTVQQGGITSDPYVQGLILQNSVKFGIEAATAWAINKPPATLVNQMKLTSQQALYALQFLDKKLMPVENALQDTTAYTSTNEDAVAVDEAQREIVNNAKIGTGPGN